MPKLNGKIQAGPAGPAARPLSPQEPGKVKVIYRYLHHLEGW